MITDTSNEVKARLMGATILFNNGVTTHRCEIIGVGNTDDDGVRTYLHIRDLEAYRTRKNGNHHSQYCGWYDLDGLKFV